MWITKELRIDKGLLVINRQPNTSYRTSCIKVSHDSWQPAMLLYNPYRDSLVSRRGGGEPREGCPPILLNLLLHSTRRDVSRGT